MKTIMEVSKEIGVTNLASKIHELGWLWKDYSGGYQPTRKAEKCKWLIKEGVGVYDRNGHWRENIVVFVTPEGEEEIKKLLLG